MTKTVLTAKAIKEAAWSRRLKCYVINPEQMQAFEDAICNDYEDYMTDLISREPGKIFDRKQTIKDFLKQLNS